MSTHRFCCCRPDTFNCCDDICSYDTSYSVSFLPMTFTFNRYRYHSGTCDLPCDGYANRSANFSLTLTITYPQGITVTRQSSESCCCYRGDFGVNIEWELTVEQYVEYQFGTPFTVCESSDTWRGNAETAACLSVFCSNNCIGNGGSPSGKGCLRHILQICNFPLVESWEPIFGDCEDGSPQPCQSGPPIGLICMGANISWLSALVPLEDIPSNGGYVWAGYGNEACNQTPWPDGSVACWEFHALNTSQTGLGVFGPFSLASYDEWSPQDPPANCLEEQLNVFLSTARPEWASSLTWQVQDTCTNIDGTWIIPGPLYV